MENNSNNSQSVPLTPFNSNVSLGVERMVRRNPRRSTRQDINYTEIRTYYRN